MLSSEFRARQCDLGKLLVLRGAMSQGHQSPITYCCMMKHPNPLGLKPQAFGPLSISMSWNLLFHWGLRNFSAFLRFPSQLAGAAASSEDLPGGSHRQEYAPLLAVLSPPLAFPRAWQLASSERTGQQPKWRRHFMTSAVFHCRSPHGGRRGHTRARRPTGGWSSWTKLKRGASPRHQPHCFIGFGKV